MSVQARASCRTPLEARAIPRYLLFPT